MEQDSALEKIGKERELFKKREKISRAFTQEYYSRKRLSEMLTNNNSETLDALCWATKEGRLDINDKTGLDSWRTAFDFYGYEGGKNLSEKCLVLEECFYEATVPERKQSRMKTGAEIKAVIWKALTFGTILGYKLIEEYRKAAYHTWTVKTLYPKEIAPAQKSHDVLRVG